VSRLVEIDQGLYWLADRRTDRMLRKAKTLIGARRIAKRHYSHVVAVDIWGPDNWYGPIETVRKSEVTQ